MSEFTMQDFQQVKEEQYMEDEFGLALKGYLLVRVIFYAIGTIMILGAILAMILGATTLDDLVGNAMATGGNGINTLLHRADKGGAIFSGFRLCMIMQAVYTVASGVCVALFYIKRTKLFAFIDIGLFVVFIGLFIVFGNFAVLGNGSAWLLYFLLNPIISFVALFVGKHFNYMPML